MSKSSTQDKMCYSTQFLMSFRDSPPTQARISYTREFLMSLNPLRNSNPTQEQHENTPDELKLFRAAMFGNRVEICQLVKREGINPDIINQRGETPLEVAFRHNQPDAIAQLLYVGASLPKHIERQLPKQFFDFQATPDHRPIFTSVLTQRLKVLAKCQAENPDKPLFVQRFRPNGPQTAEMQSTTENPQKGFTKSQ